MPKKPIIIISVLCVIALALGYWSGQEEQEVASGSDVKSPEKKEPEFLRDGLVAYYPFNGNAKDESGNGHDGIVQGPVLCNDRYQNNSSAYLFDGLNDLILMKSEPEPSNRYSFSMWINWPEKVVHSNGGYSIIAARLPWHPDNKSGVQITISNSKPAATFGWGYDGITGDTKIDNSTWNHVVGAIDGSTSYRYIYLNGERVGELKGPLFTGVEKLEIMLGGSNDGRENSFKGIIDDFRIYNRALSAEEVKALYEFEKAN